MKARDLISEVNNLIAERKFREARELLYKFTRERPAEDRERPFSVELEFTEEVESDEPGLLGDIIIPIGIDIANAIYRQIRLGEYREKINSGSFKGIKIVDEGDSWHQYPTSHQDMIDNVMNEDTLAVYSLSGAGHEIEEMVKDGEYKKAIEKEKPAAFILTGGGNDLLGDGKLSEVLNQYQNQQNPADLINDQKLKDSLDKIVSLYEGMVKGAIDIDSGLEIFGQGYGYAIPREGGKWVGKPMAAKGIPKSMWRDIIKEILKRYNDRLSRLEDKYSQFTHFNVLDRVGDSLTDWKDELHPEEPGFSRVAKPIIDKLLKIPHQNIVPDPGWEDEWPETEG